MARCVTGRGAGSLPTRQKVSHPTWLTQQTPTLVMMGVMLIGDRDWKQVVAAYKRGRQREREHWRALKHLGIEIKEDRIRADLKRLARCVATCSDDALRVLEAQTPWVGKRPALSSGMLAEYIAEAQDVMQRPNDGPEVPWGHREAVMALSKLWSGRKALGRTPAEPTPFVRWLADCLQQLDPSLDDPNDFEAADRAAFNAWRAVKPPVARSRTRRTVPT